MAVSKRIALIVDCDGTISEDTTTRLLQHVKLKADPFWERVRTLEKNGWESTLAFMNLLIEHARKVPISAKTFSAVGKKVKLSPGIPQFGQDLPGHVHERSGRAARRARLRDQGEAGRHAQPGLRSGH